MLESIGIFLESYQKVDKAHRRYFQTRLSKYGFTPNEIVVILFLYNNSPVFDTATDIARCKGISKGMIARSVESLCERNYLEAVRDKVDRRIVHLHLRDEHSAIAAEIEHTQRDFFKELERGLSEVEMKVTRETLNKLLINAELFLDGRESHAE